MAIIIIPYIYYSAFPDAQSALQIHLCNGHVLWTVPTEANSGVLPNAPLINAQPTAPLFTPQSHQGALQVHITHMSRSCAVDSTHRRTFG